MRISEKYNFRREDFRGLLVSAMPKDAMPPNFTEKTFANRQKTAKFAKVFSLESFPLYGMSRDEDGWDCHHQQTQTQRLTGGNYAR